MLVNLLLLLESMSSTGDSNSAEFWTKVRILFKPSPAVVHFILTNFHWFWGLVNNSLLQDIFMRFVLTVRINLVPDIPTYNTKYGYLNWESYYNISYYTRLLPPVPEDCPLPMGTKGKAVLPDPDVLLEKFFKRRVFKPDPQGTNLMFAFMAQHFTHQFFKTRPGVGGGFTKALGHGLINGEMYPPTVSNVPVDMRYPPTIPPEHRLAIGNELFGLVPGLSMYATIWLREHNRLCDILKEEHPTWDDEQLFQTARLIVIGETIKIIIEEYVQHLSGYLFKLKFDPSLLFKEQFHYSNRIAVEFVHLYHWHSLMPDSFLINGDDVPYSQFLHNNSLLIHYGVEKLVDSFSRQPAGQIGGGQNFNEHILGVIKSLFRESRADRLRPFNEYRKKFDLKPYSSFSELTDNVEIARDLEELYGDIDALEFYPGLILEKTHSNRIFGESMVEMGSPFSLKGLFGNPICSPEYWKPSTFGGETGFNIVKTATLRKLVCLNTKWCPYVSFNVPRDEDEPKPKNEL
ncbi:Prostaglandin G/H synthase 1 [Takifugu flavidus]|uniref:Prostaglandin G/H synthase 1 n=1 Tax=Takifugu flavidus TaxID=433684 RepID=A0A5C6N0L4_9TELE|nr:Prostaglandin G/H synthase 1 [Takifugu flavidus]